MEEAVVVDHARAVIGIGYTLFAAGANPGLQDLMGFHDAAGMLVDEVMLGISVDELVIGFGVGLVHLPFLLLIVLIAVQAFIAAQLGIRLGSRVAESTRDAAGRIAGLLLVAAAALLIIEHVAGI